MRDPVTGFIYPKDWVEKVTDSQSLELVEHGFAVLTASGTVTQARIHHRDHCGCRM